MNGEKMKIPSSVPLHEMEERYRALVEMSPEAIFINRENKVVFVNPAAVSLFGAESKEQLIGKSPFELFVPEYHSLMKQRIETLFDGGVVPRIEAQALRLDGRRVHVDVAASLIIENGVKAIQVLARDITERKLTGEMLRANMEKYRTLFESVHEGFYLAEAIFDENGVLCDATYREVNSAFLKLIGRERDQVVGRRMKEIVPAIKPGWLEVFGRVTLSGQSDTHSEYSETFKRYFEAVVFRPTAGHFGVLVSDVTERKRIELLLQKNLKENQVILDSVPAMIFFKDKDNRFIRTNKAFEDIMHLPKEKLEGISIFDIYPKEQAEAFWNDDKEVMSSGREKVGIEEQMNTPAGTRIVQTDKFPYFDEEGKVAGVIGFSQDITTRKLAEEILRNSRTAAINLMEDADEARRKSEQASIAVRYSEMRYRRLFESAKDGILILDAETGMIVDVNPFLIEMLNFTKDQFLGKKVWELGFFRDIIANQDNFLELQKKEYIRYEDLPLETADGRRIDVEFVSNVYSVENRKVIQCNIRNITERKRVESALRESQADLSRAQNVAQIGSWRMDVQKNELIWSAENHHIFNIPEGVKMTYETFLGTIHPDDVLNVDQKWKAALNGEPYDVEHRIIVAGKIKWVREMAELEFDAKGVLLGGFGTTQDITERRKVEDELRFSERRQSILSESATIMLQAVEPQKIIDDVCKKTMEFLGCQVFFNFLYDEEKNKLRLNAYQGIPEDEARKIEWLDFGVVVCGCVARDGKSIIAEDIFTTNDPRTDLVRGYGVRAYCSHPLKAGENILGTISFGTTKRDKFTEDEISMMKSTAELVTVAMQRKEWEKKLVESEERLRLAQISANVGVWEWNPHNGNFVSTPELSRLYGESHYAIRKHQDLQRKVHPDDLEKVERERNDAILSRRSFDLEFRINYTDDEIRWLSSKGGAFYDENGEVVRVFGVNADITVRKMAEEILERDKETLENIIRERSEKLLEIQMELDRAKRLSDIGTLASTVAHELRNPLAAISISAAIIRRKTRNDFIIGQLKSIDKMVTESDQIINNLLFYSRLRPPHHESIAIYDIIDECVGNLSRQIKKPVEFSRSYEPLKGVMLSADPLQMKEVFHNLLHNAVDAIPDEGGRIEILAKDYPEIVRIHVKDNGHGIDARHLEKIFDPFFTTKAQGTGLGLTVCNQIVNMHGGMIEIDSQPDMGTTMTITLPKKEKGK